MAKLKLEFLEKCYAKMPDDTTSYSLNKHQFHMALTYGPVDSLDNVVWLRRDFVECRPKQRGTHLRKVRGAVRPHSLSVRVRPFVRPSRRRATLHRRCGQAKVVAAAAAAEADVVVGRARALIVGTPMAPHYKCLRRREKSSIPSFGA